MKNLLKLEEAGQFLLSIILFNQLHYAWWVFPVGLLLPDLSMVGYLINTKVGAYIYNFFHHKLVGIGISALGFSLTNEVFLLAGLIIFGHASMDRMFGYGLKLTDNFRNTHLGWI